LITAVWPYTRTRCFDVQSRGAGFRHRNYLRPVREASVIVNGTVVISEKANERFGIAAREGVERAAGWQPDRMVARIIPASVWSRHRYGGD